MDEPLHMTDRTAERSEPATVADMVLEGACDMIYRNIGEQVDCVVILVLGPASGHICSSPSQGDDLPGLLEALAAGLRES
jgi:hypothetical protein